MMKLSENDLIELAQVYNAEGRPALTKTLREKYQVSNTYYTLKRMEKQGLIKPRTTTGEKSMNTDNVFMSMDELCSPIVTKQPRTDEAPAGTSTSDKAMEQLIQELIRDRLLELGRYITLNTSDRLIVVNKTALMADGYQMIIH